MLERICSLADAGDLDQLRLELQTDPAFIDYENSLDSILHYAIDSGNVSLLEAVLALGADVNENADGFPALHTAIDASRVSVVEALLQRGADPNVRMINDYTPLHLAADKSDLGAVEMLLRYSAEVDEETRIDDYVTPLMLAAAKGHIEMIQLLLSHGADPDHVNRLGVTAISVAAKTRGAKIAAVFEAARTLHSQNRTYDDKKSKGGRKRR